VRRKWTYNQKRLGRPPIDPALALLICRMGRENPRWGYMRIKGECQKLGISVAATTVKKVLRAARLEPAPRRDGPSWGEFLRGQAHGILACDFFSIETVFLRTLYVLFFLEVGSRRLHVTTSTRNPDGEFVAQQARNLAMDGELEGVAFLIRDRDSKYTRAFDEVFISEGVRVIKAPVRAPKANAFAERFVRTVRHEVLDLTLVLGRGPLDRILRRYAEHYNAQRPHRGLDLRSRSVRAADLTRRATRSPDRYPRRPDPRIRTGGCVMVRENAPFTQSRESRRQARGATAVRSPLGPADLLLVQRSSPGDRDRREDPRTRRRCRRGVGGRGRDRDLTQ
jgi:hypothetical protein